MEAKKQHDIATGAIAAPGVVAAYPMGSEPSKLGKAAALAAAPPNIRLPGSDSKVRSACAHACLPTGVGGHACKRVCLVLLANECWVLCKLGAVL